MKMNGHSGRGRGRQAAERESKDPYRGKVSSALQAILTKSTLLIPILLLSLMGLVNASETLFVTAMPASPIKLHPGEAATAEFHFRVGDGYHINSSRPKSELLIPTELKLEAPTAVAIKDLRYPPGKELTLSFDPTHPLSVYSGDFSVQAELSAKPAAAPGKYQLTGELHYQACSDRACYPPKKLPVNLEVEVLPAR